jgi:hypothetical protein
MRDVRSNASAHTQYAAARAVSREVKQLTWFQKNILCMNVEIHRENYQACVEHKSTMDTQQMIPHHVSGSQSAAPTATPTVDYARWSVDHYNRTEMEMHLYGVPDTQTAPNGGYGSDDGDDGDDLYSKEFDDATGEEVY